MGNICSGCQREKEAKTDAYGNSYSSKNSAILNRNLPISQFIEQSRSNYVGTLRMRSNRTNDEELFICADKSVQKAGGQAHGKDVWRSVSRNPKSFNIKTRPSTVYEIDHNVIMSHIVKAHSGTSAGSPSASVSATATDFSCTIEEDQKRKDAAEKIQKWYSQIQPSPTSKRTTENSIDLPQSAHLEFD